MPQPVSIERVFRPSDEIRDLIGELEVTLSAQYPPHQRHGLPLNALIEPHIRFFVARLAGVAAGCGGVALFGDFAEVKRMYVRPAARGLGLARALLQRIEDDTREVGLASLKLETGDRQADAMRLYEQAGFARCGPFGAYAAMSEASVATSVFFEKRLSN